MPVFKLDTIRLKWFGSIWAVDSVVTNDGCLHGFELSLKIMNRERPEGCIRVLGIDPGLAKLGYAVVDDLPDGIVHVEYGLVRTKPKDPLPVRLNEIAAVVDEIIVQFSPDVMAVETVFFAKNAKTAMTIGRVTGAVMAVAGLRGIEVVEYSPLDVKRTVVGTGRADKKQVQEMVRTLYRLDAIPKPPDVADALAICLTHLSYGLKRELEHIHLSE